MYIIKPVSQVYKKSKMPQNYGNFLFIFIIINQLSALDAKKFLLVGISGDSFLQYWTFFSTQDNIFIYNIEFNLTEILKDII